MHSGHRNRLTDKLLNLGPDALYDHELLEMLLFYSIPRVNTNAQAHRLMERFGTVADVLKADKEELEGIAGIGKKSAVLIKLVDAISERKKAEKAPRISRINTQSVTSEYLVSLFDNAKTERLFLIALDNSASVIDTLLMSEDETNFTDTAVAKIIRAAVCLDAACVILAHNHPNGLPIPSSRDIEMTQKIYVGLRTVEIKLVDHFVVSGARCNPIMHTQSNFGQNLS